MSEILELIKEYVNYVEKFSAMFLKYGSIDKLLFQWRSGKIPQSGYLDNEEKFQYHFHGVGCDIESDSINISFDFGPNGRSGGFDAWRLFLFSKNYPEKFKDIKSVDFINKELEFLKNIGLVYQPKWEPSPHLYYLKN